PRIERALETKHRQFDVGAEERFLINILTILGGAGEMNCDAQDCSIVLAHKLFESRSITLLGSTNQGCIVRTWKADSSAMHDGGQAATITHIATQGASFVGSRQGAFPIIRSRQCHAGATPVTRYRLRGAGSP